MSLALQGCAAGLSGDARATGTAGTVTQEEALAHGDNLDWGGGQTDWRLPNFPEVRGMVIRLRTYPAIDPTSFPAPPTV